MTGKYFEDLEVGQHFRHSLGRTVTEMDNVLFSSLTMNTQPLHINEDFASHTEFGQRIVNGVFVMALVVGLSVPDLTEGNIVATVGYDHVVSPHPVFHGDTIYAESEVIEKRDSRSRPEVGIVRLKHRGRKTDNTIVIELERTVLFLKKDEIRE
jgi:acyl dehydratase